MVAQFTKYSAEATHPEQVPILLRRAFQEAKTPPPGPTYVGFSANALDEVADFDLFPSPRSYPRTSPDPDAVGEAIRLLAESARPLMIISDRIAQSGAVAEAVQVAELIGCPVYHTIMHSEYNFPHDHPQFRGMLRLAWPEVEEILNQADVVLFIGKFATGFYMFSNPRLDYFHRDSKLIHIDTDPTQVGTTQRTEVGIVADPRTTLAALAEALENGPSTAFREAAAERTDALASEKRKIRDAWESNLRSHFDAAPMKPERMAFEIAQACPENALIADDSVTTREAVKQAFLDSADRIVGARGSALGWGMGGTLGLKLANPDRPVIGILGDGSAMMTVQGLWTAAAYEIPVVYVICNNGMYRVLKVNMNAYKKLIEGEQSPTSRYIGMDFPIPFDLAKIAGGMGVYGCRIEDPAQIRPEIEKALRSGKPALLDVVIDGSL